jgi:signal transduction histidine kinase
MGTVRVRTTAAAVVVLGLSIALAAGVLVVALRRSLTADVRTALELRAADVAALLEAGTSPRALAVDDGEDALVQVVSDDGGVVASSPNVAGIPPVARLDGGESTRVRGLPIDDDEFLVVAVDGDGGRFTVLAGRTLESVEESTDAVTRALVAGVPLLLLAVGATAWWLVGRALAPVEAIRSEVEGISASELHRRVPQPGDDEIGRLATTMNGMLARLEQAQARERRLVSDASHELRSPVAVIRQHAEVALAHPGRVANGELAEVAVAEAERLERLVDDLLFLARADERARTAVHGPVDVDDVVFEEAARLRGAGHPRVVTTGVSAARVLGDAPQLHRLVRNLVENAARHARSTVALSLTVRERRWAELDVDDDGAGIPPADRRRVFERFVRLDEARGRGTGGGGLGLSIVEEVARAHGGTVMVDDSPLGGARISVRLPALDE